MLGTKVMAVGVSSVVHAAAAIACWQLGMFNPTSPVPVGPQPREISIVLQQEDFSRPVEKSAALEPVPLPPVPISQPAPPPPRVQSQVARLPDAPPVQPLRVVPVAPPLQVAALTSVAPAAVIRTPAPSSPTPSDARQVPVANQVQTNVANVAGIGETGRRPQRLGPAGYRRNPAPAYPRLALRHRWEGTVVLSVKVSPEGRTLGLKIEESSGHTVLDEAALAAVRDWEFHPMMAGPLALASDVEVPVRFYLANSRDH